MTPETRDTRTPPSELVEAWRLLMTVVARSLHVSVGLVTRVGEDRSLEMTAPSFGQDYYAAGSVVDYDPGLLCDYVVTHQCELAVADARSEAEWSENPDAKLGLLAYLGFPVFWPDGEVYGTICVLDKGPRDFSEFDQNLLLSARDAIHDSLGSTQAATVGRSDVPSGSITGLWDYDPAGDRLRISAAIAQVHGIPVDQPLSLSSWLDTFAADDRERLRHLLGELSAGATSSVSYAAIVDNARKSTLIRFAARAIRNQPGPALFVVGTHTSQTLPEIAGGAGPHGSQTVLEVGPGGVVSQVGDALWPILGGGSFPTPVSLDRLQGTSAGIEDLRDGLNRVVEGRSLREVAVLSQAGHPSTVVLIEPIGGAGGTPGARARLLTDLSGSRVAALDPFFARDPLTGLLTRPALESRLRQRLEAHGASPGQGRLVLAVIEVLNVDQIVRADGFDLTDRAMIGVAEALRGADQVPASLGYGYFAVLAEVDPPDGRSRLEERLSADIRRIATRGTVRPEVSVNAVDVEDSELSKVASRLGGRPAAPARAAAPEGSAGKASRESSVAEGATGIGSNRIPPLTLRQREIAVLVTEGLSNRQIAERLVITVRTVEGHLDGIRERMGVQSRTQVVAYVLTHPEVVDPESSRRDLG